MRQASLALGKREQAPALQTNGHGLVRVVKLVFTTGTVQANCAGQPGSVVALRHNEEVVVETVEASTGPSNGSA